jgi:hypothetical protein
MRLKIILASLFLTFAVSLGASAVTMARAASTADCTTTWRLSHGLIVAGCRTNYCYVDYPNCTALTHNSGGVTYYYCNCCNIGSCIVPDDVLCYGEVQSSEPGQYVGVCVELACLNGCNKTTLSSFTQPVCPCGQ